MFKSFFFSIAICLCLAFISFSQTVGVLNYDVANAQEGYVLLQPLAFDTTYLLDNCGNAVNKWPNLYTSSTHASLTPNGTLLRSCVDPNTTYFTAGGASGILQEMDWNGNVAWEYTISDANHRLHHDLVRMDNGNILAVAWERMDALACVDAGRDPNWLPDNELWMTVVYEIEPIYPGSANIVWEWHAKDHLVQDFDSTKNNFGIISDQFRKIDINKGHENGFADWAHINGIDYHPTLDQIILCSPFFNELWIIDHSTTTAEAATSSGGNSNRGGDLLWRWGNPSSYNMGDWQDQQLFFQHDAQWVTEGTRFLNEISVFSNRDSLNGTLHSKVKIVGPVYDSNQQSYPLFNGVFEPTTATHEYTLVDTLMSPRISGAHVLPNDNILICSGNNGQFIEIDSNENVVWQYLIPISSNGTIAAQGDAVPNPKSNFEPFRYTSNYEGFTGITFTPGVPIEMNPMSCSLAANDELTHESIVVLPNPVTSVVNIQGIDEDTPLIITNYLGHKVFEGIVSNNMQIDCSKWADGVYIAHSLTNFGTRRFIKLSQ